ncbi:ATP-binding cassette domain-containing protein (plasmid) [Brevundimonas staleyi]|uniref:ATP-binding cassette domain-containing protein n=1 Tax=Brevundimonas staleyi TaxID=74326 RepID=A0ABW0FMF4_9CAUL
MLDRSTPSPGQKRARLREIERRLRHAVEPASLRWLGLALVIVTLGGGAASLAPLALKAVVDRLAGPQATGTSLGALAGLVGLYVAALLFQRLCEQIQAYAYARGEQRLVRRFGLLAYTHMLILPASFHQDHKSGGLAQSLAQGLLGLRLILTHAALTVAPVVVQIVVAGVVLGSVFGPSMGLVLLAALLAYCAVFTWGVFRLHGAVKGVSSAQIDVGGATADGLMNVEAIKAYTAERRFARRYDALLAATEDQWRVFLRLRLQNGLAVALVFAAAVAGVHLIAGRQVADGAMTIGAFVLVNTYLLQLVRPLETLGFAIRDIGQGLAYLDTIGAILDETPEPGSELPEARSAKPPPLPAELVFEDVDFGFGDRDTLQAISFRAAPGALIGIVGPSGAGKSSLLRLVLRFNEPTRGRVLFDGQPLGELPLRSLREQIALVSQDTILFNDTIGANIALAAEDADEDAITQAAARARLSEFLADLPDGLNTLVGERGLKLSGGERQRVSIARAALKNARLVILDEPTAALDPATERAIWQAMSGLSQGATTLVVTHRLSTVAEADEILVLERGRIVERGKHVELLALGGLYARLWRTQASGAFRSAATFDDDALASSF